MGGFLLARSCRFCFTEPRVVQTNGIRREIMSLASRLRAGETVFSGWCNMPDPLVMETLCRTELTAFMLDMQHGPFDTESVLQSVGIIQSAGKHTVVRIPVDRFDMASRALDFGAEGVIAPMINSAEDARRFAASMKYPPVGERSWGQLRGRPASYGAGGSGAYLAEVNAKTLAFAMIESRAAFAALDDILAVDGIDGVFVGPSDFSIAWSNGAEVDASSQAIIEPLKEIAAKAHAAGKLCGIYAADAILAKRFTGLGFTYVPLSVDTGYLQLGVKTLLAAVKS
jgi:4-hydroxy-2-oxoheptanedioate aldolase